MPRLPILVVLLTLPPLAHAEKPCAPPDLHAQALRSLALQSKLLAAQVPNQGMDESVPPLLQLQFHALKDTLTTLATESLECAPAATDPATLQTALSAALNLDSPQSAQPAPPDALDPDHIYGANLTVKVIRPTQLPILLIEFRFSVPCGTDSLLLAFEYHHVHWLSAARFQSPDYDQISGAFGDFFHYVILQPPDPPKPEDAPTWFLAIAHGHPWCASTTSAFDLDVLQPSEFLQPQHPVYREGAAYIRDTEPTLKPIPDGFELRMNTRSLDASIALHPAIYRYRVTPGSPDVSPIERIQPIADTPRDFVDAWLQTPWDEAKNWAAPEALSTLEPLHRKMEALHDPAIKDLPVFQYGPVRPCADSPLHFQIELRQASANQTVPRHAPPSYFQVRQDKQAFTLLSASTLPNSSCTGPDTLSAP